MREEEKQKKRERETFFLKAHCINERTKACSSSKSSNTRIRRRTATKGGEWERKGGASEFEDRGSKRERETSVGEKKHEFRNSSFLLRFQPPRESARARPFVSPSSRSSRLHREDTHSTLSPWCVSPTARQRRSDERETRNSFFLKRRSNETLNSLLLFFSSLKHSLNSTHRPTPACSSTSWRPTSPARRR